MINESLKILGKKKFLELNENEDILPEPAECSKQS
jgi:hypothetical protein